MPRFLIVIEHVKHNYSAYVPDLPGCIATGKTLEEVEKNMREAIELHLQGMLQDHEVIPVPTSTAVYIDVERNITEDIDQQSSLLSGFKSVAAMNKPEDYQAIREQVETMIAEDVMVEDEK